MKTTLLITVDRRLAKPLYRQVYEAFRDRVLRGELRAGQEVPSTRELARELRVSRLPLLDAYAQLIAEGYFETRQGSGTFVARSIETTQTATIPRGDRTISERASALAPWEPNPHTGALGPFQTGQPDLHSFPIDIWSRLAARHARAMHVKALQYGGPMGLPELREAIAQYLRSSRAVHCDAAQIMIVSGSQQAVDLTTRVLLDRRNAAWVEEPGYPYATQVLKTAGVRCVPVPVDSEGLDVAAGIRKARTAHAAFVTPSHQYPLGVTMSAARRMQLLEWAERAGAWIVEDDYDSEFRYEGNPIASLQGLDRNARVIYIGTLSKVMFPALRLGYVVIPRDLVGRFAAMRSLLDLGSPHSTQAVMADFIREGHFARHIRHMRPIYAHRRSVLLHALERHLGDRTTISGDAAGLHLTILCDANDRAIAAKASLHLTALSELYLGPDPRSGFILGFGNSSAERIPAAVQQLAKMIGAPALQWSY